ncbi:glutamine--tRNA ligase/YqeY domain fusion protein [SAR202 cluster bacterium AC-409-J13_OGT_754m]|nr:glutamine--tRNA ligase/YqeY domain fusion protein [SAR202 cluster bacterium AC-409-J13_OGT_754m]
MNINSDNKNKDFIRDIVEKDINSNKVGGKIITRFPPEPNGHLHIGHAKSLCLNFGIAQETGGICHLRFDDTNPTKETQEFVESIIDDIRWLGWNWEEHLYFASNYFESLYHFAIDLIEKGKAYVDDLTHDEIREYRGTLNEPGIESPYRSRTVKENLDLFIRMRSGEFGEGARVLRAKIDMESGNLNMRDPVLYRIIKASHHRTGEAWCIYPMYDFAHGQSDSIEKITHSLCTMEFEDHRPLYDWIIETLGIHHPKQIEFARLNLTHTVLSKRKLAELVQDKYVTGWDDPRMPTLAGLRRRGYTPAAIKNFCDRIGVSKRQNTIEIELLEHCGREDLNRIARRVMGVLNPIKVIIDNFPEGRVEELEALNNPEDLQAGVHSVPFTKELYIESDDFQENPSNKFYRLAPGQEVRLRYAYFITCVGLDRDQDTGEIIAIHCTYDPETKGGQAPDHRKVKGTIHWVSVTHSVEAEVRIYDHLFLDERPDQADDYRSIVNPNSLRVLKSCKIDPSVAGALAGINYQFERVGYFCIDNIDSTSDALVFNQTMPLRSSWAKANTYRV